MLVSYLILPDKRRHPSLLILNVSASIFLFSMVVYFSIGNPQKLQCANIVEVSTQDNNILCATQGKYYTKKTPFFYSFVYSYCKKK